MRKDNERSINNQPGEGEEKEILLTVEQQRKLAEMLGVGIPDDVNNQEWQAKFVTAIVNAVLETGRTSGRDRVQEIADELGIPPWKVFPALTALVSGRLG